MNCIAKCKEGWKEKRVDNEEKKIGKKRFEGKKQIKERKRKDNVNKRKHKRNGRKKEQKTQYERKIKKTEMDRKQKLSVKFKMAERRKYGGKEKKYRS